MPDVGERERRTQRRMVALFRERLRYDYLGDWTDRPGNSNIEEEHLRQFLRETQEYDDALIGGAPYTLAKAAGDTSKSLYDRNREVYDLLRYGVNISARLRCRSPPSSTGP
jgi:type I restriction enzyme R subunit